MLTKEELAKIRSAVNGRRELSFGTIRKLVDEVERLTALQTASANEVNPTSPVFKGGNGGCTHSIYAGGITGKTSLVSQLLGLK